MSSQPAPRDGIRFYDPMATPVQEAVAQMHGDRRVGVHIRVMEWTPERMVAHTYYDPGLVLPRHSHGSDSLIYILDGEVTIDGRRCPPGTQIVLPKGASIGPLIAGPDGCTFIESYAGDVAARDVDPAEYDALIAQRGITVIPKAHLTPASGGGV
jgi:ChrR-like protein with cupin domain